MGPRYIGRKIPTKVDQAVGHVKQKSPWSNKYFGITGQVVRWNFRAETGVEIVNFGQRIVHKPVSKRSTIQNICYKKHDQLVTGALSLKLVDSFLYHNKIGYQSIRHWFWQFQSESRNFPKIQTTINRCSCLFLDFLSILFYFPPT